MTFFSPSALASAARLILRDFKLRRKAMGILMGSVVVMFFLLAVPLAGWLGERPFLFIAAWAGLLFFLLGTMGLAVYDLLLLRSAEKQARRALKNRIFNEPGPSTHHK